MFGSPMEHALRIFAYLKDKGSDTSTHIHHIVNDVGGSNRTYYEVTRTLVKAGLLKSSPGAYGGYKLPEKRVTMWDLWIIFNKVNDEEDRVLYESLNVVDKFIEAMSLITVFDTSNKKAKKVFRKNG